jgi:hypothetical protein
MPHLLKKVVLSRLPHMWQGRLNGEYRLAGVVLLGGDGQLWDNDGLEEGVFAASQGDPDERSCFDFVEGVVLGDVGNDLVKQAVKYFLIHVVVLRKKVVLSVARCPRLKSCGRFEPAVNIT